jgi:hypothetical protein
MLLADRGYVMPSGSEPLLPRMVRQHAAVLLGTEANPWAGREAAEHSDNRRVDHLNGCVMRRGQRVHDPAPDTTGQRTKRL